MSERSEGAGQDAWIPEDEAHRLLARAAELDAQDGATVSLRQLQQAAEEAGIPRGAFAQALSELRAGKLEPDTMGQWISAKLANYRRVACVVSFISAAVFSPGDLVVLSALGGLGLYGAYEGAIAMARLLGRRAPPRVPPRVRHAAVALRHEPDRQLPDEAAESRFVVVVRRYLTSPDPSLT